MAADTAHSDIGESGVKRDATNARQNGTVQ